MHRNDIDKDMFQNNVQSQADINARLLSECRSYKHEILPLTEKESFLASYEVKEIKDIIKHLDGAIASLESGRAITDEKNTLMQ